MPVSRSRAGARFRIAPGAATTSSTGDALDGDADRAPLDSRSSTETITGRRCKPVEDGARPAAAQTTASSKESIRPATWISGHLAAECVGDRARAAPARWLSSNPFGCGVLRSPSSAASEPLLRLRADSRDRPQPAGASCVPKLVGGGDLERAADLDHALRADAEEPCERQKLRPHVSLQLLELCEAPRLDELLQARRDPRARRRATPARAPTRRARRPAPPSHRSSRRLAGRRARCRSSSRRGRAGPQRPRAGLRSRRS